MSILGWRVWYDQGRGFNSRSTSWADLPDDGFQVLVEYYADGNRSMITGVSKIFEVVHQVSGEIFHGGNDQTDAEIAQRYPGAVIKNGRGTTREELLAAQVEGGEARTRP